MSPWAHCRSAVTLCVITLNLCAWSLPLLLAGLLKWLIPAARPMLTRWMDRVYRAAVWVDDVWLSRVMGIEWPRPLTGLRRDRSYVVLANHVSWSDILLIQSVIVPSGPLLKFLVKRELAAIPILGLIFWAYDFPLLRRTARAGDDDAARRQRDLESVREACRVLHWNPAAMMSFAEGTRSTPAKRERQASPYRHLLRPRVGGLLALLDALGDDLEAVIDLTLGYPRNVSFWAFLSGELPRVEIDAKVFERAELPRSREATADWLAQRWAEKDERIEAWRERRAGRE